MFINNPYAKLFDRRRGCTGLRVRVRSVDGEPPETKGQQPFVFMGGVYLTKYGRNKDSNAFRLLTLMGETKEYGVFLDEFQFLFFYVNNGIVLSIAFGTSEDDPPGYDYTNRLF